jgi:hypothetical protein
MLLLPGAASIAEIQEKIGAEEKTIEKVMPS